MAQQQREHSGFLAVQTARPCRTRRWQKSLERSGGRISRSVSGMEKDERKGMSPEFAGAYIAKLALKHSVKPVYTVGFGYKCLSVLCKLLPCRLRNWIVGLLYAS